MAEFLVKAIDAIHNDPVKDARGCYKSGDIVVVMPDGHSWGNEECLPVFYVFSIPGLSVEQAKKYIEPQFLLDNKELGVVKRRKHRFPFWTKLTQKDLDDIKVSKWFVKSISESDIEAK